MKKRLRILFLADFFSFLGGTEYINYNLLAGLTHRGHEVKVCVGEKPVFDTWTAMIERLGVSLYASDTPYQDTQDITAERKFVEDTVAGLVEEWKPDVIFSHPPGKLLIAFLERFPGTQIPIVAMEYTVPGETSKYWYHPRLPEIQDRITAYIAKCEEAALGLRDYYGYQGPIYRAPNLVAGGPKEEAEPELCGALDSVGCVARLSPEKGIGFLLGAWRKTAAAFPKASLHLYGHGLHEQYYRSLADYLGLGASVVFEGTFPPVTGIAEVSKRHRVFVQPSLFESIPNSMIELMLRKKAFVASRVGGIPELLHPENREGILVSPGSTDEIAEALLRLLKNPALADDMAENAYRAACAKYDYEVTLDAYEKVFMEVAT